MNKRKITIAATFALILIITAVLYVNKGREYLTEEEILWLNEQDAIIYAANENAPPLRFVDDVDNQYKGVVVDYMNQLSLEIGADIQTVPMEWDEALESLKTGKTHICDMFINDERSQYYLFTDPIYNLRTVLLTRNNENFSMRLINEMRIATETGDYANSYLTENYPGAELVYTHNVEEGIELFLNGEVDAVIGDEPIITYLLVERNESHNPEYSNIILYQKEVVLGVSKNKPELVPILNKAIKQINNKGQLEKIQQKWFGISVPLIDDRKGAEIIKNIVISVIFASGVFILILLNNLSLQKQVRNRTRELENSRNELQIIFDGISEFMVVVDSNKNILKINKGFADYLGVSRSDAEGKNYENYIGRFCNECKDCLFDEALIHNKNIKTESIVGNEVYEMNWQPLKDKSNTLLITIKNITLDKINRNQVLQTNKMIAVGQLAAGMAHEIRNPLGIIRTQSYLIRINDRIDEAVSKSLNFIDTAVDRASKIIDNILNFSRLSSNGKQSVNINQLVQRLIEMHNDAIHKNNINVKVESNIEEELQLNQESLEHILLNLISNSVDAMEGGGTLHISTDAEDGNIIIVCEDNGCGINENDINNIYNPFFTTKELGKGTGLGLFIVYSEVEKLNGKLEVESKFGEGTRFTITLPLERKIDSDRYI